MRCSVGFVLFALSFSNLAVAKTYTEKVGVYPEYKMPKQQLGENICWALAAKSVLYNVKKKNVYTCEIVSKVKKKHSCCSTKGILDACNTSDHISRALAIYGVHSTSSAVDFERIFQELRASKVVAMITDMSNSSFGSRRGHVSIIYAAEKRTSSKGSYYIFSVADSSNGYYSFNTKDLRLKKGKYEYLSFNVSFLWERIVLIH
jgi:hypothetical protein